MRWGCSIFRWENRKFFCCLLGFVLVGCEKAKPLDDGHVVGNGGDFPISRSERARSHAMDVVSWINERRLVRQSLFQQEDVAWFVSNQEKVKSELDSLNIQWTEGYSTGTCTGASTKHCGCTLPKIGATVWLSKASCGTAPTERDLGELLLHETLHHFLGSDEERVYKLASKIYRAWENASPFISPKGVRSPEVRTRTGSLTITKNNSIFSWDPFREVEILKYEIGKGWSSHLIEQPFPTLRLSHRAVLDQPKPSRDAVALATNDDKIFLFAREGSSWDSNIIEVTPQTGQWKIVESETPTPKLRFFKQLFWGNLPLTVHDEYRLAVVDLGDTHESSIVTVFDTRQNQWRKYSVANLNTNSVFMGLAFSDNFLILFGEYSTQKDSQGKLVNLGWRLNLDTGEWTPLAQQNSPELLYGTTAVGTNDGVLIYGGWKNALDVGIETEFVRRGAWYQAATNQWLSLPKDEGPVPVDDRLYPSVDGNHIQLIGRQWMSWSVKRHSWETIESELGTFFSSLTFVGPVGPAMLFWNGFRQDGFLLAR